MRKEAYSQKELERAAEEILAELEGWECSVRQARRSAEQTGVEQLIRVIAAAAEQMAAELQDKPETMSPEANARVEAKERSEMVQDSERIERGTKTLMRMQTQDGTDTLQLQGQLYDRQMYPAAAPVSPLTPFGGKQQVLYTISDWIERDSRRYDSGFTIF